MNTRAIVGVALTGAVVLVSCTQDQPSSLSLPTEASLARGGPVSYCSPSNITSTARDYYADRNDEVFGLIDVMSAAYRAGGASGATSAGFDVLARLGTATDAGGSVLKSTATAAKASAHANAVLKCMIVAGFVPADGQVKDFASALGASGLFAVRSNAQSAAVYARGLDENDAPLFGAEPTTNGTSSNWPIKTSSTNVNEVVSPSGKALFYGWKTQENTGKLNTEDLSSVAYQLHSLPAGLKFNPKIRVGVCSMEDVNARTVHVHDAQAFILAPGGELSFCPTSVGSISPSLGSFAFATRLASWFAPKSLIAAPLTRGGGGAGLVDGLSEFGAVEYDAVITWTVPPAARTTLNTSPQFSPTITVTVKTALGTPYLGTVVLQVVGNSGAFTNPPLGSSAETNASGIATFPNLYIDKAGGYDLVAVTGIGTSAPVTFWINGQ